MTQTFEQIAARRDPLYAATMPHGEFDAALGYDTYMAQLERIDADIAAGRARTDRDASLLALAIRALRNQGADSRKIGR